MFLFHFERAILNRVDFKASSGSNFPVVTTGTANPPFSSINEKDGNLSLQFQSISCMPQYIGYSFEVSLKSSFVFPWSNNL